MRGLNVRALASNIILHYNNIIVILRCPRATVTTVIRRDPDTRVRTIYESEASPKCAQTSAKDERVYRELRDDRVDARIYIYMYINDVRDDLYAQCIYIYMYYILYNTI